ncbi:Pentatricopeptide repeat-containing protein [Camellia lanceoleosa]|uniref:Pentatricopeptide repeat-containing protein n=1 Tax=Camellia lanceoleosa TaxID=1840588 RepID=A0ACC0GNP5_9ERIC|nr:Pentatricopeptide repeat-containing protein [Camellia lanceoleosa]
MWRQVHALALKTSFDRYIYVANALIKMYSNGCDYGVYDDDYKDEAWMVFRDMKFRNLVTWNSMIAGFSIRGLEDRAMGFFSLMHCEDVGFDRATLLSVLSSLCRNRNSSSSSSDAALGLKCCFQLHCLVIKTGFLMEIGVATAIVKAYSDLGGAVDDCYNIFLETSGSRDIVSWTGIIATFAERDPEKGFFLFCQLLQEGLAADSYAFSAVLKACAGLVTQRSALAVHSQVIKAGFEDYVVVAKEAIKLFGEMNVHPDATTFVALLSACRHAGMVEEGSRIFDTMSEKYGIVPQLDHFACMVDILGRAGRVLEAKKIISEMPMEPDSVVWSAFLGACRKHGETNLANLAATKLKELDPKTH